MALIPHDMRHAPLDDVRQTAHTELDRIVRHIVATAGDETFYLFGLSVSDRHLAPLVVANTDEALARRDGLHGLGVGSADLPIDPWDPGQWRWVEPCPRIEQATRALDAQHSAWVGDDAGRRMRTWATIIGRLDDLFMEVLGELDREGSFGPSRAAGRTALVYLDEAAFTRRQLRKMFRRLNPPAIEKDLRSAWRV